MASVTTKRRAFGQPPELFNSPLYADALLAAHATATPLHVHRAVLAANSHVLHELFQQQHDDNSTVNCITLPAYPYDESVLGERDVRVEEHTLYLAVQFVYTRNIDSHALRDGELIALLLLAHWLNIRPLLSHVGQAFCRRIHATRDAYEEQTRERRVVERFVARATKRMINYWNLGMITERMTICHAVVRFFGVGDECIVHLPRRAPMLLMRSVLLKRRRLEMATMNDFHLVVKWVQADIAYRRSHLVALLKCLPIKTFSRHQVNAIRLHPLVASCKGAEVSVLELLAF